MSKQIGFSKYYKYKTVYVDIFLPNKGLAYAQINSYLFEWNVFPNVLTAHGKISWSRTDIISFIRRKKKSENEHFFCTQPLDEFH